MLEPHAECEARKTGDYKQLDAALRVGHWENTGVYLRLLFGFILVANKIQMEPGPPLQ